MITKKEVNVKKLQKRSAKLKGYALYKAYGVQPRSPGDSGWTTDENDNWILGNGTLQSGDYYRQNEYLNNNY